MRGGGGAGMGSQALPGRLCGGRINAWALGSNCSFACPCYVTMHKMERKVVTPSPCWCKVHHVDTGKKPERHLPGL